MNDFKHGVGVGFMLALFIIGLAISICPHVNTCNETSEIAD